MNSRIDLTQNRMFSEERDRFGIMMDISKLVPRDFLWDYNKYDEIEDHNRRCHKCGSVSIIYTGTYGLCDKCNSEWDNKIWIFSKK